VCVFNDFADLKVCASRIFSQLQRLSAHQAAQPQQPVISDFSHLPTAGAIVEIDLFFHIVVPSLMY
jgi:hypothetical protein